ncbi:carbohydrate ABC transporter permease [Clostridiales bacterium COT073_COT-073]|nr:carbohydrate ABC transporter permease [Clostridiales bacterium COT073_COT-073]
MKLKKVRALNQIKPLTNFLFNIIFFIAAAISIIPVIFVFMISITSEASLNDFGYRFIPAEFSSVAYAFLWKERQIILGAFWISVFVTVVGVILGLVLTTTMGYVLSRRNFKLNGFYTTVVFIPMIFNGGMVASYVVMTEVLNLKNSVWALILPIAVSSFNIIICKTFFRNTIPDSIIESGKIDGASQLQIFTRIVLPISKPVLATIGLFLSFGYWNDWFQASLYISKPELNSLQAMMNGILSSVEYIAKHPEYATSLQDKIPTESVRMAIAILVVVPIAAAYPFFQKYFITGLTIGAVKG